jgi:AhpD family alkylhydroperoxidase
MGDEVEITNHRADATQNESLIGLARMGADAFGYTAELRIDRGLAQLLRLRVSHLNNCTYCLNLHYEAAREAGVPRAKIDTLTAWWETDLHSEAEQAALRSPRPLPEFPIRMPTSRGWAERGLQTHAHFAFQLSRRRGPSGPRRTT